MNRRIFWAGVIAGAATAIYCAPGLIFMAFYETEKAITWWERRPKWS